MNEQRKGALASPHVNLSAYYNQSGDPAKALEHANKALELDPTRIEPLGRAERAQEVGLVGLARRRVDLVAARREDRDGDRADPARRAEDEHRAAASSGESRCSSSRTTDSAAVNPAVPSAIASRALRPSGSGTTQSAGTRANSA